jgi:NAD(P)-dependent dehydrogenase (short-subunit alcohol dehydrogenase family)
VRSAWLLRQARAPGRLRLTPNWKETRDMSTVLITGANRGIGFEMTKLYAAAGQRVLACCRAPAKAEKLTALAKQYPSVVPMAVEIANGESVAALRKEVGDAPLDILINNAGQPGPAFQDQSLAKMDYDGWLDTFNVNTLAPFRMLQAFRSNLAAGKDPKAVTITSQMGAIGLDMIAMYAYCASKAAVNKVMRMASFELKKDGITVALIHPGYVRTDMGGPNAAIDPDESARGIVGTIAKLTLAETGCFKKWNGETHVW